MTKRGQGDDEDVPTFDPNREAIWPTFPRGTRLPRPRINPVVDWIALVFMLALLGGAGWLIWLFIATR